MRSDGLRGPTASTVRLPRTAAVMIMCEENSTELVGNARKNISLTELDNADTKIRKVQSGFPY